MVSKKLKKGGTESEYLQRLIRHFIKTGRDRDQAVAIAYDVIRREKKEEKEVI